jgi:phosphoribosylformylglycinamidine synthase
MGEKVGAEVQLDRVPLKYAGLRYDEIWISEAQERMVLSVPEGKLEALLELAASENVEATVIGRFGTEDRELVLEYRGEEVGRLSMEFLHNGIPMPTRKAVVEIWPKGEKFHARAGSPCHGGAVLDHLLKTLAHPNVASKHWIIRQYDHEVQGGSVVKPLTGPLQVGPSDAAVVRPKLGSYRGIAIGCGLAPEVEDPYEMALAAIDEAVRNVVAVGADPNRIAVLDNFCWPSVEDEKTMGTLVRACEACRDAALAYGIPFISGKDSLHNQFTNGETGQVIRIPNTLLISAIGIMEDVRKSLTMDLKGVGNVVCLVSPGKGPDLAALRKVHGAVAEGIARGLIVSCHDVSDGGALVAAVEMAIGSELGLELILLGENEMPVWLGEMRGGYLVELPAEVMTPGSAEFDAWFKLLGGNGVQMRGSGSVTREARVRVYDSPGAQKQGRAAVDVGVEELRKAWRGTLDW